MSWCADLLTRYNLLNAEYITELQRRAALQAQGHPPPTTASLDGLSVSWNDYVRLMEDSLEKLEQRIVKSGAEGGVGESWVKLYS